MAELRRLGSRRHRAVVQFLVVCARYPVGQMANVNKFYVLLWFYVVYRVAGDRVVRRHERLDGQWAFGVRCHKLRLDRQPHGHVQILTQA